MIIYIYGIATLVFSILLSILVNRAFVSKFWKKYIKKTKTIYFIFAVCSVLLFLSMFEQLMENSTLTIVWGIHGFCFLGYSLWISKKIFFDRKRIQQAKERRLKRVEKIA